MRSTVRPLILATLCVATAPWVSAQRGAGGLTDSVRARRWAVEDELASLAIIERKVMIPMRDGIRIAADIYRPKDTSRKYPAIWVRTPYNFNFWDVANGVPRDLTAALTAVKRGFAWVDMQERGQFFAEGEWDVLGAPLTDGEDEVKWMTRRPWSNGKVGTTGCSSTAEWQLGVVARNTPGYAAFNAQGFGCGVGRIGQYYEQGNWYRGGVFMMYNLTWFYANQKPQHPVFPRNTSREDLIRLSKGWDLAGHPPAVDWWKAYWNLPLQDIIKQVGGPKGVFADSMPVATGGAMIKRTPNDSAWYRGGLYHDNMRINVPGLWYMSLYDIAIAPNLELYNLVRRTAKGAAANQQWLIIAPVGHCAFTRATEHTVVGERDMGDARLNYQDIMYEFFNLTLKGVSSSVMDTMPKVRYYVMGLNQWKTSDSWPPRGAESMTFYLSSGGKANTLHGDGVLSLTRPAAEARDTFTYDPMRPVPTRGGYRVTSDSLGLGGSFDQRKIEERSDVLVYTTEPFKEGVQLSGPIVPTLFVSSDAKDTDFTVKVIDVEPEGRAYNLDESIQRMRYRNGYDKPLVWMENGKVAKVTLQSLVTSNYFGPGHRLRIEVSSSSFPLYERNLNTGGRNFDEVKGVVARNAVHHSAQYPSSLTITVVREPQALVRAPLVPALLFACSAAAQPSSSPNVSGSVRSPDGTPIAGIEVSLDGTRLRVTTDARGLFEFNGVSNGIRTIHFRGPGYLPALAFVRVPDSSAAIYFGLVPLPRSFDVARAAASTFILGGIITDSLRRPLAGVSVDLYGPLRSAVTAADGQFAFADIRGGARVFRVRMAGYRPVIESVRLDESRGVVVQLHSLPERRDTRQTADASGFGAADQYAWHETDQRLIHRTVRAILVTRDDLAPLEGMFVDVALRTIAQGAGATAGPDLLRANGIVCAVLDGDRALGPTSLDTFRAEDVAFLELYPPGAESTGSLARHASGMGCRGARLVNARASGPYFAVVWRR